MEESYEKNEGKNQFCRHGSTIGLRPISYLPAKQVQSAREGYRKREIHLSNQEKCA
jgi:hypothetical protein